MGLCPLITPNNKGENPFIIPQKAKEKDKKLKEANSTSGKSSTSTLGETAPACLRRKTKKNNKGAKTPYNPQKQREKDKNLKKQRLTEEVKASSSV